MLKNKLSDYKPREDKFWGIYRGVVEDRNDPDKLGRCRVRVFGIHDELIEQDPAKGIPTDQLPWAEAVMGLTEGHVSGNGAWSVPLQGSHVFVFFENGNWMQPRFFATVPALPTEAPDPTKGFNDPSEGFPVSDPQYAKTREGSVHTKIFEQGLDEPDFHRLARNETIDKTVVQYRNDERDLDIPIADKSHDATDTTWSEPKSAYAAKYPENIVISTHGGHIVELDCTSGAERIHIYHPAHTFVEIDKSGSMTVRSASASYEIVIWDKNVHIQRNQNHTIDNDKTQRVGNDSMDWIGHDEDRHIMNDVYEHIERDELREVDRDMTEFIGRDESRDIGNDHTEVVGNDRDEAIGNDVNTTIGNNETRDVGANLTISVANDITITAGGKIKIEAGGKVDIDGSRIDLN